MTFFDEVSKHLNYAVSEVSSRTKEFSAVTKLNTSISAREREIESAYTQIGKLLFEREAADPESPAAALCAKVIAIRESIEEMKARIAKIKNDSKEARKAKSDELFGKPNAAVNTTAQDIPEESCSCCCTEEAETAEEPCSCCCEAAETAAEAAGCVCEAAADCAEAAAETVESAAEQVCECACDAVEAAAENTEEAAADLSDFYQKPEDNA